MENEMNAQTLSQSVPAGTDLPSTLAAFFRKIPGWPWSRTILNHRLWLIGLLQAILIFTSLVLAWILRFNFFLPDRRLLFGVAPVLIAIRIYVISRCGLMHGWWRYTDVDDA